MGMRHSHLKPITCDILGYSPLHRRRSQMIVGKDTKKNLAGNTTWCSGEVNGFSCEHRDLVSKGNSCLQD